MKLSSIFLAFLIILFLVFIGYSLSVSYEDFTTPKTCSQIWGNCTNDTTNDAFPPCNGIQEGSAEHVEEVYINDNSKLINNNMQQSLYSMWLRSHTTTQSREYFNKR